MTSHLLKTLREVLMDAVHVSFDFFKVLIPISIAMKILAELDWIRYLALPLEPVMQLTGLPADLGIAWASGTATLETALAGVPTVVSYRVAPFSALVGRLLIKVKWVSLTNLIMQKELFPELLQERATGEMMASQLAAWLDIPPQIEAVRAELAELRRRCEEPGSAARAAEKLLEALKEN